MGGMSPATQVEKQILRDSRIVLTTEVGFSQEVLRTAILGAKVARINNVHPHMLDEHRL